MIIEDTAERNVLDTMAQLLGCTAFTHDHVLASMHAEFCRAAIFRPFWQCNENAPAKAVHTNSILNFAKQKLGPIFGIDAMKDTLAQLGELGDVLHLGHGFWMPGPLRFVSSDDQGEKWVLVQGGAPLELLERQLGQSVCCAGTARFIKASRQQIGFLKQEAPVLTVDQWLGGPREDLGIWVEHTLRFLSGHLKDCGGFDIQDCEFYLPNKDGNEQLSGRWHLFGKLEKIPQSPLVFRLPSKFGPSAHYLTVLNRGALPLLRHVARIPDDIKDRLLLGLDYKFGSARRVNLQSGRDICTLTVGFKLPMPESRILLLGRPTKKNEWGYVDTYEFDARTIPFLKQVMSRIGLDVVERNLGSQYD